MKGVIVEEGEEKFRRIRRYSERRELKNCSM
jgi:hypothetical protein